MKHLKNTLNILFLLALSCFFFTSCELLEEADPCEDVTCQNGGTCDDGNCDCPDGFSGDNCEMEDLCITQNPNCQNGGTCVDGACECLDGYEGDDCSMLWRDKFIGEYTTGQIVCSYNTYDLTNISIEAHSDDTKFLLNFSDGLSITLEMITTSSNTFDMPFQQGCSTCLTEEGNGSIDENGIVTINSTLQGGCTYTITP